MKNPSRRLLHFALTAALLSGCHLLISYPSGAATGPAQDCPTNCAKKRSIMLKGCERQSADRKPQCQTDAQEQYDRCVQSCQSSDRSMDSGGGGGGKNP